jgi:hypothetical protein
LRKVYFVKSLMQDAVLRNCKDVFTMFGLTFKPILCKKLLFSSAMFQNLLLYYAYSQYNHYNIQYIYWTLIFVRPIFYEILFLENSKRGKNPFRSAPNQCSRIVMKGFLPDQPKKIGERIPAPHNIYS